jgi:hypothetical protein
MTAWLDKRGLADHLACSVRSIDNAIADGMPHAIIFGRVKFQPADVEAWLEQHGYLQRRNGDTLPSTDKRPGDANTPPGPDTGE